MDSPANERNHVVISGRLLDRKGLVHRFLYASAALVIGWFLCSKAALTEEGVTWGVVGIVAVCIAGALLRQSYYYLDLDAGELIHSVWFAGIEIRRRRKPLEQFTRIVVRHICDREAEEPDQYTGSVGLKGAEGERVVWVRDFPGNEETVPPEAIEFAESLSHQLGIPYTTLEGKLSVPEAIK